jgi:hypothetical protein
MWPIGGGGFPVAAGGSSGIGMEFGISSTRIKLLKYTHMNRVVVKA